MDIQHIQHLDGNCSATSEAKRSRDFTFVECKALIFLDCSIKGHAEGVGLTLDIRSATLNRVDEAECNGLALC
jgi:hypothetical protein